MKFSELLLHDQVMQGLSSHGFIECTPIQEQVIPHILKGLDVAGLAQTGTGKTAAFLVPLMDRLVRSMSPSSSEPLPERPLFADWRESQFVLVLVPTRELAEQVSENAKKLGIGFSCRVATIYGGTSYEAQKKALQAGAHFVVATPGRLIDLYKEQLINLSQVRAVVFDEADRMFDMGFKDDMKYILKRIPKDRQFLVFSATLNFDVLNTAYEFGANPVEINVSRDQAKAENVKDEIFHVGQDEKPQFLLSILAKQQPKQVIIFSNFKHNVERIAHFLNDNGWPAMAISSLLTQAQRHRVMELFKSDNEKNILVATDLAARGLDVKGVDLVINYELPDDPENYVHRIGRTGRAGAKGLAIGLVGDRDVEALQRIENYLEQKVSIAWLDENEIVKNFKPIRSDKKSDKRNDRGFERGHDRSRSKSFDRKNDRKYDNREARRSDRDSEHLRDSQRDSYRPSAQPSMDSSGSQNKNFNKNVHPNSKNLNSFKNKNSGHQQSQKGSQYKSANPRKPFQYRPKKSASLGQLFGKKPSVVQKVTDFFKKLFS